MTFPFFCFSFYPYLLTFGSDGRLEPVDHTVILAFRTVYARRGQFRIGHGIEIHHLVRGQAVVRIGQL